MQRTVQFFSMNECILSTGTYFAEIAIEERKTILKFIYIKFSVLAKPCKMFSTYSVHPSKFPLTHHFLPPKPNIQFTRPL